MPRLALASAPGARALAFSHTHTGEQISLVYAMGDHVLPDAQQALNRFLRDHYSGDVGNIDPKLFGLLADLRGVLGADQAYEVISGYRSPVTNERLRKSRGGGVARRSLLHMDGMAIDIRLPGVPLADLRDAAVSLGGGGVGIYTRQLRARGYRPGAALGLSFPARAARRPRGFMSESDSSTLIIHQSDWPHLTLRASRRLYSPEFSFFRIASIHGLIHRSIWIICITFLSFGGKPRTRPYFVRITATTCCGLVSRNVPLPAGTPAGIFLAIIDSSLI